MQTTAAAGGVQRKEEEWHEAEATAEGSTATEAHQQQGGDSHSACNELRADTAHTRLLMHSTPTYWVVELIVRHTHRGKRAKCESESNTTAPEPTAPSLAALAVPSSHHIYTSTTIIMAAAAPGAKPRRPQPGRKREEEGGGDGGGEKEEISRRGHVCVER
jgi:hypothetical protein